MKSLKICFLLIVAIPFLGCGAQQAYSDLDKLYADFVVYLKDSNDGNLKKYCYKITPDKETVKYMKANNFSYRGIPDELEKRKMEATEIGDQYYKSVSRFKEKLIRRQQLDDLTYIGRERREEELFNKELNIYATETFILLESKGDTIRCKLGEMLRINNAWKSFTSPRL